MYRPHLIVWLLLAGAGPGSECSIATGPEGFCAAIRLEPRHFELPIGGTLQIKITGLDCVRDRTRVHWSSSVPDVVAVDSTGLVRARRTGAADVRLESEESVPRILASMRVIVR
jgi:hypothetical protein